MDGNQVAHAGRAAFGGQLKDKAKAKATARRREGERDGPVLGGADYVELMLGGRRKAAAEAAKLPQDPDPDSP